LSADKLNWLRGEKLLQIFGYNIWSGIHDSNWKHRAICAKAVLQYMKKPISERLLVEKKTLF